MKNYYFGTLLLKQFRALLAVRSATCVGALLVFALAGCALPKGKVVSKRDPSFEGQLQRMLIVCPDKRVSSLLGKQFSQRFLTQFTNALAQHNVSADSVALNKDSLENDSVIEKAAKNFRAGQLLSWSIAGMNTSSTVSQTMPGDIPSFRSNTSVNLEFSVGDVWVNRIVWRARFSFETSPAPEAVADQLMEELVAAKLLVGQHPQ